ncbi:hypothetical protein YC2023_105846 [Brassica napus]
MLPTTSRSRSSPSSSRANPMFLQYFRRIVKVLFPPYISRFPQSSISSQIRLDSRLKIMWQQMDVEYTFWQMLNLCTSPKVVYDHSGSHAVVVVVSVFLTHFLITGAVIATCCWFLTNSYLREEAPNSHVVEQRVEWLYTFDVHCNSFFPMFVLLYVVHYFLSPLLITHGFIALLLSNLLFMVGASYYHYLNFLGYDVLPFLERTTFFLYPIGIVIVLSPISKDYKTKQATSVESQGLCTAYTSSREKRV